MKAPNLTFSQWLAYFSSVGSLSPIPKTLKFGQVPEGVLRLGGTFGINGDKIVYRYDDGVPGDHPTPLDVINSLVTSSSI